MTVNIPEGYKPSLNVKETEIAIKQIKDYFERALAAELSLTRVSAPLFVVPGSGLNDDLSGIERPVAFAVKDMADSEVQIVHSLAKWKRAALHKYGFVNGEGIYTDMNAIRKDEELDNLHSIYVDQWDWEKVILGKNRNADTLKSVVSAIYRVFKLTEHYITNLYPQLEKYLPEDVHFISSEELLRRYPKMTPKQREDAVCKEYGAVFVTEIGGALSDGKPHDGRAPDYDDWSLNGDLLFWYPVLKKAFEVTSMGIRVDAGALKTQLETAGCLDRLSMPFHRDIMNGVLPFTMGGGLGQSRICMFFLGKAHVGEVHASVWPQDMIDICDRNGVSLL